MKSMQRVIAFLVLVSACLLAGCKGTPEALVVGDYQLDMGQTEMAKTGDPMAKQMSESLKLSVRKDHTFSMNMVFMPIEGTWTVDGNNLVLTTSSVMGKQSSSSSANPENGKGNSGGLTVTTGSNQGPMTLAISPDGKALTLVDKTNSAAAGTPAMTFKKI